MSCDVLGYRWLVTHLGGFFIKRRLDFSDRKDVLYRKCLHEVWCEREGGEMVGRRTMAM